MERGAELFAETARQSVAARERFTVALSGGSTPRALYELLAEEPYSTRIPWEACEVFWSDERCVPPESDESNYRMAYEALLARVPVAEERVHRMRGEAEPESAARAYEKLLKERFDQDPPRLDLILLGMGEDGHTASLFPHSVALVDTGHLVAANFVEKLKTQRLTLTFRVINSAASIIFLVSGETKAATLQKVLEGETRGQEYPAQLVSPTAGDLIWLVDEAAAKSLSL